MANSEDVLERAIDWYCDDKTLLYHRGSILRDLIDHVRELRVKLDSEAGHRLSLCADNERFVAEVRELREDLVWAVQSAAIATNVFDGCQYLDWDGYDFDQDGTPDSICRAVREARDGE